MEDNVYLTINRPAPRRGAKWSPEEEQYLVKAVRRGDSVERICDLLGRTYNGVVGKLQQLYLLRLCVPGYYFEWNYPKAHRRGTVPRQWAPPIKITPRQMKQFQRFFRNFE